jgi:ABC-type polysaccharide/polyol phosphate transport system ATPase subunit
MSKPLVKILGLAKKYSRNRGTTRRLVRINVLQTLFGLSNRNNWADDGREQFFALDDVSFSVKRGEVMGIIGHNGAGKTTLLDILAGHFLPDAGSVKLTGRVVSLINLTNGMSGDLTGRENIFTKMALYGLTKKQTQARVQEIIDFAELAHCIDAPYRTYSSGMKMRLAFAINVHSDADVVLIDEVLSVGDMAFRNKCFNHFQKIKSQVAIVLVSHSMNDIVRFCDEAILLQGGKIKHVGAPSKIVELYQDSVTQRDLARSESAAETDKRVMAYSGAHIEADAEHFRMGHVKLNGHDMNTETNLRHGEAVSCEFCFDVRDAQQTLNLSLVFYHNGEQIFNLETSADGVEVSTTAIEAQAETGWRRVQLSCMIDRFPIVHGALQPVFLVHDGPKYLLRQPLATLSVHKDLPHRYGLFSVAKKWRSDADKTEKM